MFLLTIRKHWRNFLTRPIKVRNVFLSRSRPRCHWILGKEVINPTKYTMPRFFSSSPQISQFDQVTETRGLSSIIDPLLGMVVGCDGGCFGLYVLMISKVRPVFLIKRVPHSFVNFGHHLRNSTSFTTMTSFLNDSTRVAVIRHVGWLRGYDVNIYVCGTALRTFCLTK